MQTRMVLVSDYRRQSMSLANRTDVFDETVVNAETDSKEDDIESEHAPAHDFG